MKCKYCGKDVPNGEIYCACGNPVVYSKSEVQGNSFNNNNFDSNNGLNNNNFAPSYVAPPQNNKRSGSKSVMSILIVVATVVGGLLAYFDNTSLTIKSRYKEVSTSGYSFKIPKALKEKTLYGYEEIEAMSSEVKGYSNFNDNAIFCL